jgi:hypothetical protein
LKKSAGLAVKKLWGQFWSSASSLNETPRCADRWRERGEEVVIRWGEVRRVERMCKKLPVERSRIPEWPLPSCLQCVVGRCHAEESLHVVDPGVFAGLIPPDGEVVDNSVQK